MKYDEGPLNDSTTRGQVKALSKRPGARFESAEEMREASRRWAALVTLPWQSALPFDTGIRHCHSALQLMVTPY
jgi:hypothetical protein